MKHESHGVSHDPCIVHYNLLILQHSFWLQLWSLLFAEQLMLCPVLLRLRQLRPLWKHRLVEAKSWIRMLHLLHNECCCRTLSSSLQTNLTQCSSGILNNNVLMVLDFCCSQEKRNCVQEWVNQIQKMWTCTTCKCNGYRINCSEESWTWFIKYSSCHWHCQDVLKHLVLQ